MEKSPIELLLTDEFCVFAAEVSKIHEEKKHMKEELKKIYERFQGDLATLDNRAQDLSTKWEAWKNEHSQKTVEAKKK